MRGRSFRQLAVLGLATALSVPVSLPAAAAPTVDTVSPGLNGRIAFVRAGDIYTVQPGGTGLRRLTYTGSNGGPAWSADGTRIAFHREDRTGNRDICVMRADGTGVQRITRSPSQDSDPTWSPDGTRIAFENVK